MNKIFSARVAERWDPYHGKYRPYLLPEDELKCSLLEDRMDKVIACAGCGKPVKFGESFTSLEIHTESGFGFMVCPMCIDQETERARDAEAMRQEEEECFIWQ